jgi:hypothetical protein
LVKSTHALRLRLTKIEKQQDRTTSDAEKRMIQREIDWLKETINMRICQEVGRTKRGRNNKIIDGAEGTIRLTTNNKKGRNP